VNDLYKKLNLEEHRLKQRLNDENSWQETASLEGSSMIIRKIKKWFE